MFHELRIHYAHASQPSLLPAQTKLVSPFGYDLKVNQRSIVVAEKLWARESKVLDRAASGFRIRTNQHSVLGCPLPLRNRLEFKVPDSDRRGANSSDPASVKDIVLLRRSVALSLRR